MVQEFLSINVKLPSDWNGNVDTIFRQAGEVAAEKSAEILYSKTVSELRARRHVASRDLISTLKTEMRGTATNSLVSLVTFDIAANALEYGTNPHHGVGPSGGEATVNVANILSWIQDKGIRADDGDEKSFAYAIARNIARKGMTVQGRVVKHAPRRPFNAAQKKAKREIDRLWEQTVANITSQLNKLGQ